MFFMSLSMKLLVSQFEQQADGSDLLISTWNVEYSSSVPMDEDEMLYEVWDDIVRSYDLPNPYTFKVALAV
jgi:hypothetical protein